MSLIQTRISRAGVSFDGGTISQRLDLPGGTVGAPALTFGDSDTGLFAVGANEVTVVSAGLGVMNFNGNKQIRVKSNAYFNWTASGQDSGGTSPSLRLEHFPTGVPELAVHNSTSNVTRLSVYETRTDASNYSRIALITAAGDFNIMQEAAGTGTLRGLNIGVSAGNLCFYGGTPVALQTGVAVSAAGVHAALVALNLITA